MTNIILQMGIITKIFDYELGPGETSEGVWHVKAMSHEEILATAIYYLHSNDVIKGGNILFKRAFEMDEAAFVLGKWGSDEGLSPNLN
jgi:hypothetical protein